MSKIYEALRLAQVERQAPTPRLLREVPQPSAFEARPAPAHAPQPEPVFEPPPAPHTVQPNLKPRRADGRLASREAMLSLYVKVESLIGATGSRIVTVMGSRAGEGATSIARELALAVAEGSDRQVLLIDANPSGNGLHRSFRLTEGIGLEELARHKMLVDPAVQQLSPPNLHLARLSLETVGSSSMLDATPLDGLLAQLRERFTDIIIDAPPVVSSGAGMVLAKRTDGIVLVLAAERTRAPVVEQAKKIIEANQSRLLGVVMNRRRHHIPKFIYRLL
jgi:Mrp family chromosome partitioning ATPase